MAEIAHELKEQNPHFAFYYSKSGSDYLSTDEKSEVNEAMHFDNLVILWDPDPEPDNVRKSIKVTDRLLFIYTSGTTGLPKAVNITHIRFTFFLDKNNIIFSKIKLSQERTHRFYFIFQS